MLSNPTMLKSWEKLNHHKVSNDYTLKSLFSDDSARFEKFHIRLDGFIYDFSKNLLSEETLDLLCDFAKEQGVENFRDALFSGEKINNTEGRSVLHPALRGSVDSDVEVDGENVNSFVKNTQTQIKELSESIRSNPQITDIVNIGIGGSDLGPRMICEALAPMVDGPRPHFVSNVDGGDLWGTLRHLNPENTAFIIASKTFTTLETMRNARTAMAWAGQSDFFYAVSANVEAAEEFGIVPERVLPLRDWVGGRFSVWGSIGFSIAVSLGFERFKDFLDGAHAVDRHFLDAPLKKNIPVIMALLSVWYRNFYDYRAHAVLPYAESFSSFPLYIQQLCMESNGKSVDREGQAISYQTCPVTFGSAGTNAQHAYFQQLHQGPDIVPCDLLAFKQPHDIPPNIPPEIKNDLQDHHTKLLANVLAQAQALMDGKESPDNLHRNFTGNRPSSFFLFEKLDAYHLGMLLALYEHKVCVEGALWNINSYDQWGVELGKILAKDILSVLEGDEGGSSLDSSTKSLAQIIKSTHN